ncbi:MAG: hypothetical protein ABR503_02175 [Chitinophagaceae bacterium]
MIALFKQKSPGNIGMLFIFGLLIKLPIFIYPKIATPSEADGKAYHWIFSFFGLPSNLILASVIAFGLLYLQALLITILVNEYRMTGRPTFLPAMSYLLITSLLPEWNYLSPPLIATTFIMWAISKLFRLYNLPAANSKIFNIGLLIGLASFFYFPSLLFSICIFVGMMVLRPFRINEFVLLIVGIASPYYFYSIYLFLTDRFALQQIIPSNYLNAPYMRNSIWFVASAIFLGVPFVAGGYYIQTHLRKMLIQARKNWSVLLLYLVVALFIAFINSSGLFTNWIIMIAPFAAFHACTYFYPPRKWLPIAIFWTMLAFILTQQYATSAWH